MTEFQSLQKTRYDSYISCTLRSSECNFFSHTQALSGIGLVIFTALDFGLGEDQERALSDDLEALLDLLASEGMYEKLPSAGVVSKLLKAIKLHHDSNCRKFT